MEIIRRPLMIWSQPDDESEPPSDPGKEPDSPSDDSSSPESSSGTIRTKSSSEEKGIEDIEIPGAFV